MGLLKPKVQLYVADISSRAIIRVIAWVVGFSLALHFFGRVAHALTLVFVAFFLALALNPAVSKIMHYLPSRSRIRATAAAYLTVVAVLASFLLAVVPPLIHQTQLFIAEVPSIIEDYKSQDTAAARFVSRYNLDQQVDKLSRDITGHFNGIQPVVSTASRIGGIVASVIAVFILTFMMLVEGPVWLEKFWELQPARKRAHRKQLADRMYRIVTGYVNGQLILATIAASFALLMMLIIGVPNAIALAGIVAVLGLIPLIGNMTAAAIVVIVSLFTSPKLAIIMAIYFVVYMQVENATLQPYIQSRHNEITPLLVFVAALVGAGFGGLLGAFVAIPAAGCLKILVEDYIARRKPADEAVKSA
jgi:predicted PurR-regulated permease PerM